MCKTLLRDVLKKPEAGYNTDETALSEFHQEK